MLDGGSRRSVVLPRLDPTGNQTILRNFGPMPDGENPYGGLIIDESRGSIHLFGTTYGEESGALCRRLRSLNRNLVPGNPKDSTTYVLIQAC